MFRRITYLLIITALSALSCFGRKSAEAASGHPFTVVIDPGHGGKDIGCRGKITNEKTIVLDVAKRLGDIIAREHPEVKTVFTRSDDRFIELNRRAAIANKAHGDLFISIHVNSVDAKNRNRANIHGAQVYTLGLHRTDDNLDVAMRENSVIELEADYSETYQGFDPNSSESYIIFELTQNRHQQNSIEFADAVQQELLSTAGRADKGVRQAGFLVLRASSMAAVLVELDFICNPAAEQFLASEKGREKCARSIANAFSAYYKRHNTCNAGTATNSGKSRNIRETKSSDDDKADTSQPAGDLSQPAEAYYSVQFLTAPEVLADSDTRLKGVDSVDMYLHQGVCKYISGKYKSLADAKKAMRQLKKRFPEAFIVKMRDGQRIEP